MFPAPSARSVGPDVIETILHPQLNQHLHRLMIATAIISLPLHNCNDLATFRRDALPVFEQMDQEEPPHWVSQLANLDPHQPGQDPVPFTAADNDGKHHNAITLLRTPPTL